MMRFALKALTGCVVLTLVFAVATNVEARHRRCCGGYGYGGWGGGYQTSYAQPMYTGGSQGACAGVSGSSYGGSMQQTGAWDGQGAYGQGAYGQGAYGTQSTFGAPGAYGSAGATYGTQTGAYGAHTSAYGPQGGINNQQNANNAPPPPPASQTQGQNVGTNQQNSNTNPNQNQNQNQNNQNQNQNNQNQGNNQ